jgi:DNA polymerase-3 subunit gamma/tau
MTYQVLARKYRPQTFTDVAGQDAVVQTLVRALESGRVAHAFLFTGSRGIGKTTLARILAKCLVCERGVGPSPCGVCTLCKGVAQGTLTDVVEIDGASNNSVEQVRDLQEVARYLPQHARFKIFIIDEVHMLSVSAFNALLKILEEPPPHVKFIFATTEPHKIPVTILSRCQRYDFRRLPQKTIVARLKQVLELEKVSVSDAGLEVIARAAEGGMRDALSLTDQVLSFAGDGASADQVTEALGIIDRRSIASATEACIRGDAKSALSVVDNAYQRGHDLRQLLAGVAEELRHLCVSQATGSVRGMADLTDEEIARLDARAKELDARDLTRLLALALDAIDPVAKAEDPRLFVELAMLKMCGRPPLGEALAISEAIVRLEALAKGKPVPPLSRATPRAPSAQPAAAANENGAEDVGRGLAPRVGTPAAEKGGGQAPALQGEKGGGQAPALPGAPATLPPTLFDGEDPPPVAEINEPVEGPPTAELEVADGAEDDDIDPAAGLPLDGVDPRFVAFVDAVARAARPMAMHFDHARVWHVDAGRVEVFFPRDLHERAVANAVDAPAVRDALERAYGQGTRLIIVKPPADPSRAAPSIAEARQRALDEAQRQLEQHAKRHPVVEKAVALFGGQVRSVKRR